MSSFIFSFQDVKDQNDTMKTVFVKWLYVGIGSFSFGLVFLGLNLMSIETKKRTEDYDLSVNVRDLIMEESHKSPVKPQARKVHATNSIDSKVSKIKSMLVQLSKEINNARTHIRGTKARGSVENALSIVTNLLKITNTTTDDIKRKTSPSKHICMEVYKGTTYGYPFFYKGFEIENCSYALPVESLVTVIVLHRGGDDTSIPSILKSLNKYNNRLKIVIGAPNVEKVSKASLYDNVKYIQIPHDFSDGKAWNSLIEQVQTKYTLIGRNITYFNIDARVERLVREIESLNVTVVGGASRDKNGHWNLGCYQRAYKNFSLVYEYGYDESLHECIFCDYINAPFLTRTNTLKQVKFDDKMRSSSVFHDFFLQLSEKKRESVVCPDSMFYVHRQKGSMNPKTWIDLANKWNLHQLKIADEVDIVFSCSGSRHGWTKSLGYAIHPCSLQELADMVKFIMNLCELSGIICELQEGTLLGAVKFHTVLPWERDADLTFLTSNFTAFDNLKQQISKRYTVSTDKASVWCCADNRTAGGKAKVHSGNWHIELYGQHKMDSEMLLDEGFKPTKVLLDGQWVWVPRNPGWHARNRYGHEIYAHAQHWMAMGKGDGWINYKTNEFTQCRTPGRHDCLDNFNANGNIQFSIPIP